MHCLNIQQQVTEQLLRSSAYLVVWPREFSDSVEGKSTEICSKLTKFIGYSRFREE